MKHSGSLYMPWITIEVDKNSDAHKARIGTKHIEWIGEGRDMWCKTWTWKVKSESDNKVTLIWDS